jgi:hypothetical protein
MYPNAPQLHLYCTEIFSRYPRKNPRFPCKNAHPVPFSVGEGWAPIFLPPGRPKLGE